MRTSIKKFTMEKEDDVAIPFLVVLFVKERTSLKMTVYKKPTHTGYLHFESNHPPQVKKFVISFMYRINIFL